ncbi:MAG TPA: class I SAM-dependent methyltransferase, partial [Acidimicrobiales bacterium]|nr:class I SAM-dependent methyltransferase [Acidimicrobiales bacterium]
SERSVTALEPAAGMRSLARPVRWIGGEAEHLPLRDASVDAAYSTWAYFFSRNWDPTPGLAELQRVVRPGGLMAIVDNLGDDEFTALAPDPTALSADPEFWKQQGFEYRVINTRFEFDSPTEAEELLTLYFGESPDHKNRQTLTYRVALFTRGA